METAPIEHETFRNESTIVSNFTVAFDGDGKAVVPLSIAGDAIGIPGFKIPEWVKPNLDKLEREESLAVVGPYDAGRLVLVHNTDHAGISATDSDNQTVQFDEKGYARCGERTALNLRRINGEQIKTAEEKEKDKTEATKSVLMGRLAQPAPTPFTIFELDGSAYQDPEAKFETIVTESEPDVMRPRENAKPPKVTKQPRQQRKATAAKATSVAPTEETVEETIHNKETQNVAGELAGQEPVPVS